MWEQFEKQLEAEDPLGAEIKARDIIGRFAGSQETEEDLKFRDVLSGLSRRDLRTLYNRLVRETGGPSGPISPDADPRLVELRMLAGAAIGLLTARKDELVAGDLPAAQACTKTDEGVEPVLRRAVAGEASREHVPVLEAAVREYRAVMKEYVLSEGGRNVIGYKAGRALDGLGRASEALLDDVAAQEHFEAARRAYAEIGDDRAAAVCQEKRDAAAQRQVADTDVRLERLLTNLDTAPPRSVERAAVLVGLAELANGNGDAFEAEARLDEAVETLRDAGFSVPADDRTDRAVETWIEKWIKAVVRPGDGEDPNYFLREMTEVLVLQTRVAALRMALKPEAVHAEANFVRLTEIVQEIPRHTAAVHARLRARLGEDEGEDKGESGPQGREFMKVMRAVNALVSVGPEIAGNGEAAQRWLRQAAECLARARELGDPLTLAQALEAVARVHVAAGDLTAAVPLLEEEYGLAASLFGKTSTDQAILAMTSLAKVQTMLQDFAAASHACDRAIALIERDRYRVNAPFQQAAYLAPHADVFTAGVFSAWKGAYDTMLARMELSKAHASVRQLFTPEAPAPEELDRELADLGDAINGPAPSEHRDALRRRRLQLWDRRAIAQRNPETETPTVTVAGVQALLGLQDAVVYYYWLRPEVLLIATITKTATAADRVIFKPGDRAKLEAFIDVISTLSGSINLDDHIRPLAPLLTPVTGRPLLDGKKRLLISPHRLLHWYPFAAMPYEGQRLVQAFALRQVPNLTSLLIPRPSPRPPRSVGIAVSEFPGREATRGPLVVARAATVEMAEVHKAAGVPAELMLEPTRAELVGALRDGTLNSAWCLHFAGHGHSVDDEISKNAPMESMLDLADGQVDGYDIAAADLGCDVVVLTACDSGQLAIRGRGMAEQPGDELFGLPAAFLQARCGSVLAPIWPADQATVSRLVVEFHRNLARGALPEFALARAQRQFLDAANFKERRPYYWASLMLTGVGQPIEGDIS